MRLMIYATTIFVIATLSSCGKKMNPLDYNEIIVRTHDRTWQLLNHKQQEIYDYQSTSRESAQIIVDSLYFEFDSIIRYIDSLQYPAEASEFHKSTLIFYKYIKDSVIYLYGESLNYEPTSEQWYELWNKIEKKLDVEASRLENNLIAEQVKFVKKVSINY